MAPWTIDLGSPFRNRCITSGLPWVYPAILASPSNLDTYVSMWEKVICRAPRSFQARSGLFESWNWLLNSTRN